MVDSFFCEACLMNKPLTEQSLDPRYCRPCCDFLTEEAKLSSTKPDWVPKVPKRTIELPPKVSQMPIPPPVVAKKAVTSTSTIVGKGKRVVTGKMATRIAELMSQGLASRTIALQLEAEGIEVSHITVSRWMKELRQPRLLPEN